eukprot:CAMPEP_0116873682 /NCGR_PEP_ID=MMETSP0463-20121206/4927_1 /TAXON_ID=181622 /ORGANISM="Strombidinopsis sp, Strain SopsisLIS2011" /LENGTH=78 /DNA_ID=CAMNT_0004516137 /DNA_START=246 /DNA_END=482 /DNA_ORIENTATION=+
MENYGDITIDANAYDFEIVSSNGTVTFEAKYDHDADSGSSLLVHRNGENSKIHCNGDLESIELTNNFGFFYMNGTVVS